MSLSIGIAYIPLESARLNVYCDLKRCAVVEIDSMMLRRTNDPLGEYRQIILYQGEGPLHSVWEATGFLSRPDFSFVKRQQLKIGNRTDMQKLFAETAQSLRDEGFAVCEPDLSA